MTPDAQSLLRKIESFDIDGGPCDLPFAARLAREHGWSRPHAERVIREYKRYAFLAMQSDSPVCPSEDVDAAWHLHLTYTKSYWKRFCGKCSAARCTTTLPAAARTKGRSTSGCTTRRSQRIAQPSAKRRPRTSGPTHTNGSAATRGSGW